MTVLLDSDVLISGLRGTPAAQAWLAAASEDTMLVPGIVAMEVVNGCLNSVELHRVLRFLSTYTVDWHNEDEFSLAFDLLVSHRLAAGIGMSDCLVAASALRRGLRLCTFNRRHYAVVAGLDVQEPYART